MTNLCYLYNSQDFINHYLNIISNEIRFFILLKIKSLKMAPCLVFETFHQLKEKKSEVFSFISKHISNLKNDREKTPTNTQTM